MVQRIPGALLSRCELQENFQVPPQLHQGNDRGAECDKHPGDPASDAPGPELGRLGASIITPFVMDSRWILPNRVRSASDRIKMMSL